MRRAARFVIHAISERDDPPRAEMAVPLRAAIADRQVTILTGGVGLGQIATIRSAMGSDASTELIFADGRWLTSGYLAGFHELLAQTLAFAEASAPEIVARHEQTLKRICPARSSDAYRVPRDLTHSSDRSERTRFYHQEYQNKLLVGLADFLLDILRESDRHILLVVENASGLSPTSRSLIRILMRQRGTEKHLRLVLLDEHDTFSSREETTLRFPPYSEEVFFDHLALGGLSAASSGDSIYRMSRGNLAVGRALKHCLEYGISTLGQLHAEAVVDLYLGTVSFDDKVGLAVEHIRRGWSGDFISRRNTETIDAAVLDGEKRAQHRAAMERYQRGEGPLVLGHALELSGRVERLQALVEPSEILMGIGLYDTWFSYFAEMFVDPGLRAHGDGDQTENGLFINAAFVLYASGNAAVSAPFLEEFIERFPRSRFIPTALYAQSMTYGRYQHPVDLGRAEDYALRNLALIDGQFHTHPKHEYIKVFAENAYAYIKARQGKFEEALELCERGNAEILSAYGTTSYQLHRSILIYNTSQVYEIIGNYEKAEARLREAIACDPYYGEYQNDLGNLLSKVRDREREALEAYARAIELCPPYYEAHLNRGILHAQMGEPSRALADFERALEIKPEEWRALREVGNVRLTTGDALGALKAYARALEYETGDADLHANAGVALSELGDSGGAIRSYRFAIRLHPSHAAAHNNLAAELTNLGQYDEALRHAQLATQNADDPDFETNRMTIERLCATAAC